MKRHFPICVFMCTALSTASAIAAEYTLCDDLAARLSEQSALLLAKPDLRPIQLLSSGPEPLVELASGSDGARVSNDSGIRAWEEINKRFGGVNPEKPPVNENDYAIAFEKKFNPDPNLADAVAHLLMGEYVEVESLSDSSVHALTAAGGSANCVNFLFFDVRPNGRSRLLPDPPPSMDGNMAPDLGPHRTECYVSAGYLSRIQGQTAFVVTDYEPTAFGSDLRLAAYEGGNWTHSCRVKINFQTKYRVAKAYVPEGGPLSREELTRIAPQIALAMDSAIAAKRTLSFGPPVPIRDRERVRQAVDAAKDGRVQFEDRVHVPKTDNWGDFGVPSSGMVVDPIVLNGTPYVITIEHPVFGWRDEPGYSLVIYQIGSAKLSMIAVAEISAERGPLRSIKVGSK